MTLKKEKKEKILSFIQNEEIKLVKSSDNREKMNLTNNIIRMKMGLYNGSKLQENIYKNAKDWINYYILTIDCNNYQYDSFDKYKILKLVKLLSLSQQVSIYKYLIRQLKINAHTNDKIIWCEECIKKTEIKLLLKECKFGNSIKLVLAFSSYNIYMLIISFLILLIVINAILLPESYLGFKLFEITYAKYTDDFLTNHIINIMNYLFNFYNNGFNIITDNIVKVLILLILKILFYLIIINFIFKQFVRSITKYE